MKLYNCYRYIFLNSSVVECLLSMRKVLGSILSLVYFLFADYHLLQLQHLKYAGYRALINSCKARTDCDFFFVGQ